MNKLLIVLFIANLILAGCGQATPDTNAINTAIAQTQAAEAPRATDTEEPVEVEEPAQPPTNTPMPSITPLPPTDTPIPTEAPSIDDLWSKNYVGSFDSGGVIIEIARVLVGYKAALPDWDWDEFNDYFDGWAETEVVGELLFKVTNNTEKSVNMYLDQGSVQIGNEQIDIVDFMFATNFGDYVGGMIYPGVTKIGGMWFGIKLSTPAEITEIIYRCSAPYDFASGNDLGPDYVITIDVSTHVWEEIPDELK